jgi:hypothetical protein
MEFYYTLIAYEVKFCTAVEHLNLEKISDMPTKSGEAHELRVFLTSDLAQGQELARLFTDVGLQVDGKTCRRGPASARAGSVHLSRGSGQRRLRGAEKKVWP